jgi:hypothetical protein
MPQTAIQWQKSSFSGAGGENCVELTYHDGQILIRESDTPDIIITATAARLRSLFETLQTE